MKKKYPGLILACSLLAVLAGCGSSKELKSVCDTFLESYAQGDSQTLAELFGSTKDEVQMGEIQSALAEKISIKTGNTKKKGKTAVVSAVITSPDLETLLNALPEEIDSTDEAKEALVKAIEGENTAVKEFLVEIALEQNEDEKWQIRMTPELADALLGGYYSIMSEMVEGVAE